MLGVIAPPALMVNPPVLLNEPPLVPVMVGFWAAALLVQNGVPYETVAVGDAVTVTNVVVVNTAHPPAAATVYVTVYVPAVLALGSISPVVALMVKPNVELYVPPVVPVCVTACKPLFEQNGLA